MWRVPRKEGGTRVAAPAAELAAWAGHVAPLSALQWAPRRMAIASAGPDGALLMWLPNLAALNAAAARRGAGAYQPNGEHSTMSGQTAKHV